MTQISGKEGTQLPEGRRSQEFALTEYDAHQERQRRRNWTLNDVPFYKGKGKSLEQNPFDWHDYDYLNYYDEVFGRKCGSAGIGKLREVGLVRVSDDDNYAEHPYMKEDPDYIVRDGMLEERKMDIGKLREQQLMYAEALTSCGVQDLLDRVSGKADGGLRSDDQSALSGRADHPAGGLDHPQEGLRARAPVGLRPYRVPRALGLLEPRHRAFAHRRRARPCGYRACSWPTTSTSTPSASRPTRPAWSRFLPVLKRACRRRRPHSAHLHAGHGAISTTARVSPHTPT